MSDGRRTMSHPLTGGTYPTAGRTNILRRAENIQLQNIIPQQAEHIPRQNIIPPQVEHNFISYDGESLSHGGTYPNPTAGGTHPITNGRQNVSHRPDLILQQVEHTFHSRQQHGTLKDVAIARGDSQRSQKDSEGHQSGFQTSCSSHTAVLILALT